MVTQDKVNPERHNLIGVFSWGHRCLVRCDCNSAALLNIDKMYLDWVPRSVCQDHTPPAVDQRQHQRENMSTSLVFVIFYHVNNMISMDK